MKLFSSYYWHQFDKILLTIIILLVCFGLIIQYGLSLNTPADGLSNFNKQLIFSFVGFVLLIIFGTIDYRLLKSISYLIYILAILLLIFVLFFGQTYRGVKGWIALGPISFQLTELVKLVIIIALANFWKKPVRQLPWSKILISLIFVVPPIILIARQPDLGSAIILFFIWLGMLLVIDKNPKHFLIIVILGIILILVSYFFVLKDYQRERIITLFNPSRDPLGRGYQITQSIIAVGSGKIFGQGLTFGPQSQLRFLPASQTDFIFAVIAEETGLFGCLLIIILFFLLFRRLAYLSKTVYDSFAGLILTGIMINFFIHFILNIGMNIGILPIIGIPLPFVSYGGSSLLVSLISIGLVESIVTHKTFASI